VSDVMPFNPRLSFYFLGTLFIGTVKHKRFAADRAPLSQVAPESLLKAVVDVDHF
jgi:hypothetical protein